MGSEIPKTVSSRLLTMPFMQRAIAKDTSSPSTPTTPQSTEPSTKKRKTQHTPGPHGNNAPAIDQAALNAALADEERKRQIALDKRAKELGDSRWVLNFPTGAAPGSAAQKPLNIVLVGYGHIDKDEDDKKTTPNKFMRFNMNKKDKQAKEFLESLGKSQDTGESGSNDGDSDSGSAESDAEDQQSSGKQLLPKGPRAAIRTRQSEEKVRANKFAEQRRKKDVNPNRPKSISAISGISAGGRGSASPNYSTMTCHACGEKGHPKAKCPKANAAKARS